VDAGRGAGLEDVSVRRLLEIALRDRPRDETRHLGPQVGGRVGDPGGHLVGDARGQLAEMRRGLQTQRGRCQHLDRPVVEAPRERGALLLVDLDQRVHRIRLVTALSHEGGAS
jgi:hypothetical protein